MTRRFYVNGPAMVFIRGGRHLLPDQDEDDIPFHNLRQELGLTSEAIRIVPTFQHRDIRSDGAGMSVPAEVMWDSAECRIFMDLVHYDSEILATCIQESAAGGAIVDGDGEMGNLAAPSALMGNGLPLLASGNHFIELSIDSPIKDTPWTFPSAYLAQEPFIYPIGTEASVARLVWRAISYVPLFEAVGGGFITPEVRSKGKPLWHHDSV